MDLSQFAVDSLVVVAVFVIVNLVVKPLIEVWITQTNVAHDPLIRGLAVFLGVIGVFVDHGFPPPAAAGSVWIGLVLSGILSGLSAIGLFHVASTGSASPADTGTVSPAVPSTADLAAAFAAALTPVLARLGAPSPTHQAAGMDRTFTFPPAANANSRDNVPVNLPPAGPPAPSPAPEPAAPAAPPAQP